MVAEMLMFGFGWVSTDRLVGGAVLGSVGAPVIVGAAILGFGVSWAFGEYIFDGTLGGDDVKKWLKSK